MKTCLLGVAFGVAAVTGGSCRSSASAEQTAVIDSFAENRADGQVAEFDLPSIDAGPGHDWFEAQVDLRLLDSQRSGEGLDFGVLLLGGFGTPCQHDQECEPWLVCVKVDDAPRFCGLERCWDECPQDWGCYLAEEFLPDEVFRCLPKPHLLCELCHFDVECIHIDGRCVEMTGDSRGHCTTGCQGDSECPEGYTCLRIVGSDSEETEQCVPTSGMCGER